MKHSVCERQRVCVWEQNTSCSWMSEKMREREKENKEGGLLVGGFHHAIDIFFSFCSLFFYAINFNKIASYLHFINSTVVKFSSTVSYFCTIIFYLKFTDINPCLVYSWTCKLAKISFMKHILLIFLTLNRIFYFFLILICVFLINFNFSSLNSFTTKENPFFF